MFEDAHFIADICIHTSYVLSMAAYLVRDIFYLRLLAIAAAIAAILYSVFAQEWSIGYWETGIVIVNIVQVALLLRERRNAIFNTEEQELRESLFQHFSAVQLKALLKQAVWVDAPSGELLTEQGKPVARLTLIKNGLASVAIDDVIVAYCKHNDFIGEMSFVSGEAATATVATMLPTRYLMWTQDDLRKLLEHDEAMRVAMQTVLTKNLVIKLTKKKS